MEAYTGFAEVYDIFMDETPYEEWCDCLTELLEKYQEDGAAERNTEQVSPACREGAEDQGELLYRPDGMNRNIVAAGTGNSCLPETDDDVIKKNLQQEHNSILDLGCGTGTLTELLARRGYDMIGIDNAQEMLRIAMDKREASGLDILYLLQDMREFELYGTVGAVISVCDSVNYLLEEDEIVQTFRLVNNYLFPGGIFIFDFNTVYKYKEMIGDTTIAENREACSFIWDNYYHEEEEINEYDLTIFVRENAEAGLYRRFQETHYQRGYRLEQMKDCLRRAGLVFLEATDADTHGKVTGKSERIYVVARKGQ